MAAPKATTHVLPLGLYLKVGATLLVLTVITVWVAQYNLGALNLIVAMTIAGIKATLVALFFMHLKYANRLYAVILVGALLMVAIFIIFTMFDTLGRDRLDRVKAGPINPNAVIYEPAEPVESIADSAAQSDSVASGVDKGQ